MDKGKGLNGRDTRPKVAVIGGGIAGISAALSLAKYGVSVDLVEKDFALGGHAYRFACKAAEQCNKCSVCIVNESMRELATNERITLHLGSTISGAQQNGDNSWRLGVSIRPRRVDTKLCTACGLCEDVCPTDPKSIALPQPDAAPFAFSVREDTCVFLKDQSCRKCEQICPAKAVKLDEKPSEKTIEADAVVLATGFAPFDAIKKAQYGYGRLPNVITGIELESALRYSGEPLRPTDRRRARRIAFIQCVGSRELRAGNDYCSQVCCMYASRLASTIKANWPDSEVTIFYMDLQTFGKGFTEFVDDWSNRVRFLREMPGSVELNPATGDLVVKVEEKGANKVSEYAFDMVVLSVGITPSPGAERLANMLGVEIDAHGFLKAAESFNLTATKNPRVFLAGACNGPKDIAESITQADSCAEKVMVLLGEK
jgi:heterodisulfide reductase subunit A